MFASAMQNNMFTTTWNNAKSLATPDMSDEYTGRVALFFKAIRRISDDELETKIRKAVLESLNDAIVLAFNIRDCRGGKGERDIGRKLFKWLNDNIPSFKHVIHLIPEYGRYDDLFYLLQEGKDELILSLISEQLRKDKSLMFQGKPISLLAKWCPTEKDSDDRQFHLVKMVCDFMCITPKQYRKEYITPLRSYLNVVETLICAGRWTDIELSKVPSCAIKKLKKSFEKHIPDIFKEWKDGLKSGKTTVNAKVLFPYEIIREIRTKGFADEVCTAQWKVLEDELRNSGVLESSVVVVDMSGSMNDPKFLPIDNAISLGLIVSSVVTGEFHNHVISFADNPKFLKLDDVSIHEKYRQIQSLDVGYSTNIQKVFDLILKRGKAAKLTDKDMPKKIDMQFNDNSISGNDETNFEEIDKKYKKSGFTRPELIFWNVNGSSTDYPVSIHDTGTCLISGSSPSILKSILTTPNFSTLEIMKTEINSERYKPIRDLL